MQLIATILLASAYICLQLPAIDYLYRIEKVYNYLLHFLAYRDIVYMLLVVFRCASLFGRPPVSLDAGGVFISSSGTYCPRIPFWGKKYG